jgi:hypothetical protein
MEEWSNMSNAKKYFGMPKPEEENNYDSDNSVIPEENKGTNSSNGSAFGSGTLEGIIDKVKKKVTEPDSSKKKTESYDASLPEQIIPDYRDSLDGVVGDPRNQGNESGSGSKNSGSNSGSSSRKRNSKSNPSSVLNPPPGAGPFSYAVGEFLQKAKNELVDNPDDPIYQFSKKIGKHILPDSNHFADNVIREVAGLGIYFFLNGFFEKATYKK